MITHCTRPEVKQMMGSGNSRKPLKFGEQLWNSHICSPNSLILAGGQFFHLDLFYAFPHHWVLDRLEQGCQKGADWTKKKGVKYTWPVTTQTEYMIWWEWILCLWHKKHRGEKGLIKSDTCQRCPLQMDGIAEFFCTENIRSLVCAEWHPHYNHLQIKFKYTLRNIARGTTDPGYWVPNLNDLFSAKIISNLFQSEKWFKL